MFSTASAARLDSVSERATKLAAALLTRMSNGRSLKATSISSSTASAWRRSTRWMRTGRPNSVWNSCAVAASTASRRPQIMRSAPNGRKRRPIALPRPVPPPVIRIERLFRRSGTNIRRFPWLRPAAYHPPSAGGTGMRLFDLDGRVAVVTGGNGGIGLGMARGLAEAGAAVVIAGRNKAKNESAAAELAKTGAKATGVIVDVTDEASCRALVAACVKVFGRLDILVNNAGINIRKRPQEYAVAEWNAVLATNLSSAFICSQAAYPEMLRAGGGNIINTGSMMSIFGAAYAV